MREVSFYILFLVSFGYGQLFDAGTRANLLVSSRVPITHTSRTNTRYVDPTNGSDTNNGLNAATSWKTVAANVARIPIDTEVVFKDGDYTFIESIYYTTDQASPLAAGITFRPQTYRGVTLRGVAKPKRNRDGQAFVFIDGGDSDVEIYGFKFNGWDCGRAGIIYGYDNCDGIRVIANSFDTSGDSKNDHIIYWSCGPSATATQKNWVIQYNEVVMQKGSGAFIHIYGGTSGLFGPQNCDIKYNIVTGNGRWAIEYDNVREKGSKVNMVIANNIFNATFHDAAMEFSFYGARSRNGVDVTCVVKDNEMWNHRVGHGGNVIIVAAPNKGQKPHVPTLRNNNYHTSPGHNALNGISAGPGDVVYTDVGVK